MTRFFFLTIACWFLLNPHQSAAQSVLGGLKFEKHCASCHRNPETGSHAPNLETLKQFTPERVLAALNSGPMAAIAQAAGLKEEEMKSIAEYATLRPLGSADSGHASAMTNQCESNPTITAPEKQAIWNGWGPDMSNMRYQSGEMAKLTPTEVTRLQMKWAFAAPGATTMYSQPTVISGRMYFSSDAGYVYSVNAKTGCVYWSFQAKAGVRTAIIIDETRTKHGRKYTAYFGDVRSNAYAIDAQSGKKIWSHRVDEHPLSRITGSMVLHKDRLYIPISSWEETAGANISYECCTFRGSVVSLDAASGKQLWKTYTIFEPPQHVRKNSIGTQLWAPAGAAVWSTPTVDPDKQVLFVATGNAYTAPAAETSDGVIAMSMKTGKVLWWRQMVKNDAWLVGCSPNDENRTENCPDINLQNISYNDVDMGASPILVNVSSRHKALIVAGESGGVYALDPKRKGKLLWRTHLGEAEAGQWQPGIGLGAATDGKNIYLALERYTGGLTAVELGSGERVWHTPGQKANCVDDTPGCNAMQQGAVTAIPGVVFSGAGDGMLRAYSTENGRIIWEFNTARDFKTVNGAAGKGGSVRGPGVTVVDGMVYVNSGYGAVSGMPGNILIAFEAVAAKQE